MLAESDLKDPSLFQIEDIDPAVHSHQESLVVVKHFCVGGAGGDGQGLLDVGPPLPVLAKFVFELHSLQIVVGDVVVDESVKKNKVTMT